MKSDNIHPILKWLLKKICKVIVVQGPYHKANITEYYRIIRKYSQKEFNEDNEPTLHSFLRECYKNAEMQ